MLDTMCRESVRERMREMDREDRLARGQGHVADRTRNADNRCD